MLRYFGVSRRISSLARLGLLGLFAGAVLASCAAGQLRTFYSEDGTPEPFKRRARYVTVDYVHRFRALAYRPARHIAEVGLSMDQKAALVDHGVPDFVRRPFVSQYGERVEEWIYLRPSILLQFVKGSQVFKGNVTDLEQILIERGYPRHYILSEEAMGPRRETFVYRSWFGSRLETYNFANGRMVQKDE